MCDKLFCTPVTVVLQYQGCLVHRSLGGWVSIQTEHQLHQLEPVGTEILVPEININFINIFDFGPKHCQI